MHSGISLLLEESVYQIHSLKGTNIRKKKKEKRKGNNSKKVKNRKGKFETCPHSLNTIKMSKWESSTKCERSLLTLLCIYHKGIHRNSECKNMNVRM